VKVGLEVATIDLHDHGRITRGAHTAQPFRPFYLRLGDGQRLPVMHPEMLAYSPRSRIATVHLDNGSFEIVDLLLVTALEVITNGRRRRR
jgi:hypothetical protein